jgi:hypothetical protein
MTKQWIEEQIRKDTVELRRVIHKYSSEYESQPHRVDSLVTRDANEFFTHFYRTISENELDVYNRLTMTRWNKTGYLKTNSSEPTNVGAGAGTIHISKTGVITDDYIESMDFKIERIKSAADLPRPRILETLRHQFDSGRGRNPDGDEDRYIPRIVYSYIRDKAEYWIQFNYDNLNGRNITLHFITFPESHISICTSSSSGYNSTLCADEIAIYKTYAYKVFLWLTMVTKLADKGCSGTSLNVYFYMTPFKKNIPSATSSTHEGDTLSAIHVNTGLTRNCENDGEIIIYRAEEWFKVFIHESMHNFNMDFIENDLSEMNKRMRESFNISHGDVLFFETYTESWARIVNTMFETYFDPNIRNQTAFIHKVRENLSHNAMFSVYQAVKILDLMDLKYAQLTITSRENIEVCRKRYKEDTNVYAYYILGGLIAVYALQFISWCRHTNRHNSSTIRNTFRRNPALDSIRFLNEDATLYKFVDFMREISRKPEILGMIAFCEKKLHKTPKRGSRSSDHGERLEKTLRMTL